MKCSFVNSIITDKPAAARGFYRVPGAQSLTCRLNEGRLYVQEWTLHNFQVCYIQSLLHEKIVFEMRHLGEAEILVCCLKTSLEINSFSNPLCRLNPEYAQVYQQKNFQAFCVLNASRQKSSLLVVTHSSSLDSLEPKPQDQQPQPFLLQARMLELIEKIIHTSYDDPRPFQQEQLRDLVTMAVQEAGRNRQQVHFDEVNMAGIYAVREWLDKNMDKAYSEQVLIQKAGMNIKKLNKGFADLFGFTPYHYLRISRLNKAHETICASGANLKSVAKAAGYRSYTNFSSAFTSFFGYSPVSLRKRKNL